MTLQTADEIYRFNACRILIVDDDQPNHDIVSAFLDDMGVDQIISGYDGIEGLELIAQHRPHLVILDIVMPRLDGLDMLRQLRALPDFATIPVIVLTGNDSAESRDSMFAAGATDFVTKPLLAQEFIGRVHTHLKNLLLVQGLETQLDKTASTLEELRAAQSQLIQAEKMASLGGLVAGIAHEVNTPVGIVLSTATHFAAMTQRFRSLVADSKLTRSDLDTFTNQAAEAAKLLTTNAERAAKLIESFKRVSVDQTSDAKRDFNLLQYIEETLVSLSPKLKTAPVTVAVNIPHTIQCDTYPGPLSQTVTNLVINSLQHGFDDGRSGNITISAQLDADDHVTLTYQDDGKGIAAENAKHVFDPFFTTKRGSGGSGLGMHITYNLVTEALNGTIGLNSQPECGVTFTIRFPRRRTIG